MGGLSRRDIDERETDEIHKIISSAEACGGFPPEVGELLRAVVPQAQRELDELAGASKELEPVLVALETLCSMIVGMTIEGCSAPEHFDIAARRVFANALVASLDALRAARSEIISGGKGHGESS